MTTPRIALPEISESQASKYLTHNDALRILDALAQPVVQASTNTPPGSPSNGQCWIVTATATGAWTGQETKIAQYYGAAWHFIAPTNGFAFWDIAAAALKRFNGTAWA